MRPPIPQTRTSTLLKLSVANAICGQNERERGEKKRDEKGEEGEGEQTGGSTRVVNKMGDRGVRGGGGAAMAMELKENGKP